MSWTYFKVLYVYRNPKDVAVSYFHFASVLSYVQYSGPFERFARLFIRDKGKFRKPPQMKLCLSQTLLIDSSLEPIHPKEPIHF